MLGIFVGLVVSIITISLQPNIDASFAGGIFGEYFRLAIVAGGAIIGWLIEQTLQFLGLLDKKTKSR